MTFDDDFFFATATCYAVDAVDGDATKKGNDHEKSRCPTEMLPSYQVLVPLSLPSLLLQMMMMWHTVEDLRE